MQIITIVRSGPRASYYFKTALKIQFHRFAVVRIEKPMEWFPRDIDNELRSANPPSGEMIVALYLMMDTEFMPSFLRRNRGFRGQPSITSISHDQLHPLYSKVKFAFDWAQKRRILAGFPPDQWPMCFEPAIMRDRRLLWEPTQREIREAWKLYHRFSREGLIPFCVDSQGDPLHRISSFDPCSGEIMFRVGD